MPGQAIFAGAISGEARQDRTEAEWGAFVRTAVYQRVELTVHVVYADLATGHGDDLACAGGDFVNGSDDVAGHQELTPPRERQANGTADARGYTQMEPWTPWLRESLCGWAVLGVNDQDGLNAHL
jgi:hypothetical protein